MHRTQISLEERQYNNLRHYAQNKKLSISAVIRDLLDKHVPDLQCKDMKASPLHQIKGIVAGKGEFRGKEHNKALYTHESHWNEKQ